MINIDAFPFEISNITCNKGAIDLLSTLSLKEISVISP